VEVVASLSQGRTAAAQCGLFTYKSVPVIFEPPCITEEIPTFCFTFPTDSEKQNLQSIISIRENVQCDVSNPL